MVKVVLGWFPVVFMLDIFLRTEFSLNVQLTWVDNKNVGGLLCSTY